jgi:hypothetical protein
MFGGETMQEKHENWVAIIGFLTLAIVLGTEGLAFVGTQGDGASRGDRASSTALMSVSFNHSRQF